MELRDITAAVFEGEGREGRDGRGEEAGGMLAEVEDEGQSQRAQLADDLPGLT